MAPSRTADIKGAISLVLSVLASLMSLGGIAYAAGSLTTRVDNVEERVRDLKDVPQDVATIKQQLAYLVEVQRRQEDRDVADDRRSSRNERDGH